MRVPRSSKLRRGGMSTLLLVVVMSAAACSSTGGPSFNAPGNPPGCEAGAIPDGESQTLTIEGTDVAVLGVPLDGIEFTVVGDQCFDVVDNWTAGEAYDPALPQTIADIREQFCNKSGIEEELNALLGHGLVVVTSPTPADHPQELHDAGLCAYSAPLGLGSSTQITLQWQGNDDGSGNGGQPSTYDQKLAANVSLGMEAVPVEGLGQEASMLTNDFGVVVMAYDGYTDIDATYWVSATYIQSPDVELDVDAVAGRLTEWVRAALPLAQGLYA